MSDNHVTPQHQVDDLNQQAWQCRVSDSYNAEILSKQAIQLAEAINYKTGLAEGYRTFAFTLIRQSKHDEALANCNKAMNWFKELGHLSGQASVYEYYGIIERSRGNLSVSLQHLYQGIEYARLANDEENESLALYHIGATYKYLGDYDKALEYLLTGLSIARKINNWIPESYCINLIGQVYFENGDYNNALEYFEQSLGIRKSTGDKWGEAGCLDNIGVIHLKLKSFGQAQQFFESSLEICEAIEDRKGKGNVLLHLGELNRDLNKMVIARDFANKSMHIRREIGDKKGEAEIALFLAELSKASLREEQDSSKTLELLDSAMHLATQTGSADLIAKIHLSYSEAFKTIHNFPQALQHLEDYLRLSKEVHSEAVNLKIKNLEISHGVEKSRQEAEIYRLRNIELASMYEESNRQKGVIEEQKRNVENAFTNLKEAQAQLIQAEKMASLGELTAGIAHEIQNPLNFINNFSEVNNELIVELREEMNIGNLEMAKALTDMIEENELKINHHGKRADLIVKGMLQHSRVSTGQKEPGNLNALADEFLRLSYHGFRAKNKLFNAAIQSNFDPSITAIKIIPQDLGRVLLNIYNNAFYSMAEKKSQYPTTYEPMLSVHTKQIHTTLKNYLVEIRVKDNGTGIPAKLLHKIYQPFFTTKPTGQGTGLGLSLSYDIVKAHGGEIKVETKEGEGTEFIITIGGEP